MPATEDEFLNASPEEQARIMAEWEDEYGPIGVGGTLPGTLSFPDKNEPGEVNAKFPALFDGIVSDMPLFHEH